MMVGRNEVMVGRNEIVVRFQKGIGQVFPTIDLIDS
jgi:hypothetical protein